MLLEGAPCPRAQAPWRKAPPTDQHRSAGDQASPARRRGVVDNARELIRVARAIAPPPSSQASTRRGRRCRRVPKASASARAATFPGAAKPRPTSSCGPARAAQEAAPRRRATTCRCPTGRRRRRTRAPARVRRVRRSRRRGRRRTPRLPRGTAPGPGRGKSTPGWRRPRPARREARRGGLRGLGLLEGRSPLLRSTQVRSSRTRSAGDRSPASDRDHRKVGVAGLPDRARTRARIAGCCRSLLADEDRDGACTPDRLFESRHPPQARSEARCRKKC